MTDKQARIQSIRSEVRIDYERGQQYGFIGHSCPECGALVGWVQDHDFNSPSKQVVKIFCDDECGFLILL